MYLIPSEGEIAVGWLSNMRTVDDMAIEDTLAENGLEICGNRVWLFKPPDLIQDVGRIIMGIITEQTGELRQLGILKLPVYDDYDRQAQLGDALVFTAPIERDWDDPEEWITNVMMAARQSCRRIQDMGPLPVDPAY